jgi:hypothetical protein
MDFSAPGSDDDGLMVDDAEQERRNEIVLALESWTTLAHRMYECNEVSFLNTCAFFFSFFVVFLSTPAHISILMFIAQQK